MKPHAIPRRDPEDDTETNTEQQSDHGRIIVPAEIPRDDHPRPDSDVNDNGRYYRTDYAGDDDGVSAAGNMGGELGRHYSSTNGGIMLL